MHLLNLRQVKSDLIEERLSESNAFSYFLAVLTVDALLINFSLAFPSEIEPNVVSFLEVLVPVTIFVIATLVLYQTNGGASGKSFFTRYFPLIWVVGLRFLPLATLCLGAWLYFFVYELDADYPTWNGLAVSNSIYALYYWRVWIHFRDVRSRARST